MIIITAKLDDVGAMIVNKSELDYIDPREDGPALVLELGYVDDDFTYLVLDVDHDSTNPKALVRKGSLDLVGKIVEALSKGLPR